MTRQGGTTVTVVPLTTEHFADADRVFRLAFATFLGIEDPTTFGSGRDFIRSRLAAYPDGAIAALVDGTLVGSNIMSNWGSFAFFGPLTVNPTLWGTGIAKRLLARTVETFDRWGTRWAGLFTFADSPKHQGLYQRFDFWPRYICVVMSKAAAAAVMSSAQRFSALDAGEREACLEASLELCDALLEGLDVHEDALVIQRLELGESVWLWSDARLEAFALCHFGANSEAEPNQCYVKFAAVRPGGAAQRWFVELLHACEALAADKGLSTVSGGMNVERGAAYRTMLREGFVTTFCGVQMFRRNDPAYNRYEAFVIDDLR